MVDKSLAFGLQNFFITAVDESDGTYNYYGYLDKKGSTLLMRTNKAVTEIRYWVGTGTFATLWAAKATKTYTTPDQLKDPNIS
jgi:hypothetical protein